MKIWLLDVLGVSQHLTTQTRVYTISGTLWKAWMLPFQISIFSCCLLRKHNSRITNYFFIIIIHQSLPKIFNFWLKIGYKKVLWNFGKSLGSSQNDDSIMLLEGHLHFPSVGKAASTLQNFRMGWRIKSEMACEVDSPVHLQRPGSIQVPPIEP